MTTPHLIKKSPRKTQEQWQTIVDAFSTSNLSAPEFCKQQHIQYSSFSKWRQRFSEKISTKEYCEEDASSFIDVSALVNENKNWNITLKLGNGVELVLNQA